MNNNSNNLHNHHHCDCGHNHDEEYDDTCDIDPSKTCDNCMRCLNTFNTDKEGFVQIKIDKFDTSNNTLKDFYQMYGLDDEDDEE